MYSFRNDYSQGAHPQILERLNQTNLEQTVGYGEDDYCRAARDLIRRRTACPAAAVWFIPGGTQANLLAIAAALRPHEAAMAAETGHINVHETGAIEATGHKILTVTTPDGKLTPTLLEPLRLAHTDCHMVKPRLVYISQSTELGTVYTKAELTALRDYCLSHNLLLYLDGARLGVGLESLACDLNLADIAALTDAFTLGGTKNGALFGEALVLTNPALQADFGYLVKQRGAMLAKGRLLGLQFLALLEDGLYERLAQHANALAQRLQEGIAAKGYGFLSHSPTNQLFPLFPDRLAQDLMARYGCELWQTQPDGFTCIRFVTSWGTPAEAIEDCLAYLPPAR